MGNKFISWLLFTLLCIIWGSSFILMKLGMHVLSPYQVASLRILSAGIVLLPFAYKAWQKIPKNKIGFVVLSGLCGSFFPAYLFCLAETRIDSSLTAILNSLTPMFTIIMGTLFFKLQVSKKKLAGILIGFSGLCLLPFAANKIIELKDISYALLVLLATAFYGFNVNMVSKHLKQAGSLNIASMAFVFLIVPCLIMLFATGYFNYPLTNADYVKSTLASAVLGVFGTAIASVLFYMLVKRAGPVFASLIPYGIPFIAVMWGLMDGEIITGLQVVCLFIILSGVYLVNK